MSWLHVEEGDLVAFSKEEKVARNATDEDALQRIMKRPQREQYAKSKGCYITTPKPLRMPTGHPHPSCKQDTFSYLEKATVTPSFREQTAHLRIGLPREGEPLPYNGSAAFGNRRYIFGIVTAGDS